jgi:hypothetical protein
MPVNVDNFQEFEAKLVEAATTLGMRFVFGPEPAGKRTEAGWHDAWFDAGIPGLLKLNCFFKVPGPLFDEIKKTPWSAHVNQIVFRPAKYNKALGRADKGVNGTVIYNGNAAPAGRQVLGVLGTNEKNEHYEVALYENRLYKPPQLNLELKLVSDKRGDNGKPVESLVINAHVDCA